MGASSNFGNMFSVLGAAILLPFEPLSPILILLNNFIYDFSQTAIPFDRVESDQILKPRQWDISGIRGFMIWLGPVSSLFDYLTFALMWFVVCPHVCGGTWSELVAAGNSAGQAQFIVLFHTGWFIESNITQTLVVHVIRSSQMPGVGWMKPRESNRSAVSPVSSSSSRRPHASGSSSGESRPAGSSSRNSATAGRSWRMKVTVPSSWRGSTATPPGWRMIW